MGTIIQILHCWKILRIDSKVIKFESLCSTCHIKFWFFLTKNDDYYQKPKRNSRMAQAWDQAKLSPCLDTDIVFVLVFDSDCSWQIWSSLAPSQISLPSSGHFDRIDFLKKQKYKFLFHCITKMENLEPHKYRWTLSTA